MSKKINNMVFVYGTLKRGFGNHRLMDEIGGEFVSEAVTVERLPLTTTGLPYLFNEPGEGYHVKGELYLITHKEGWGVLDQLEGVARNHYYRAWVRVHDSVGNTVRVQAYFACHERNRRMAVKQEYSRGRRVSA